MSNTGMPAYRPTADSIWSSFRSSGKRHLILTGTRGSGKTTLLGRLFPGGRPGLTTWARPCTDVWIRENGTGREALAGLFDPALPGPENRMRPVDRGFEELGVPALMRCMEADSPWITLDEVGYLEVSCTGYRQALLQLLEKKQVAAVVRKQALPFLQQLCSRSDAFVVDLDDPFGNVGCVIMASGMSSRFGSNKLLVPFHGRPLIRGILDATQGIFARRVVVTRHPEVARLCAEAEIPAVLHSLPGRDDTVRLGLQALEGVQRCMFCAADQPLLSRDTVAALALASNNDPGALWRTAWEGTPGNPVVFPQWALPELRTLPAGSGGSAVIKKYPERLRTVSVRDGYELKDADTPEDLAALAER